MVTGQAGTPWEAGHFWDWLLTRQAPVLMEPLVKFLRPVVYFFSPRASWLTRLYFLLDILVVLATWAFFGGAITRMAAVEVARNEKISALEAMRFVGKRYLSFIFAPIIPLLLVAVLVVILIVFGLFHTYLFGFGSIVVDGLLWWIPLILGLFMAFLLVCLVSWPMMTATVSAEDEEGLNAFARAYSYVIQAPWHYLWYSVVALAYGAVVIFFVGFMGSFTVYLASWGVGQTPGIGWADRRPMFLFIDAPTSFGWRALLLEGAGGEKGQPVVRNGEIIETNYDDYVSHLALWNVIASWMVAFWLGILFLLILGFGYSYFWTASTIIYLLMRRQVDDAELDEVYFEEEDQEDYLPPPPPGKPSAAPPPPASPGMTMVEPPALRISTPAAPTAPPAPAAAPPAPVDHNTGSEAHPATAVTPPPSQTEEPRPDGDANRTPPPPGGAPL
jgi:hypothetical protein